jgi:hypothetical protein
MVFSKFSVFVRPDSAEKTAAETGWNNQNPANLFISRDIVENPVLFDLSAPQELVKLSIQRSRSGHVFGPFILDLTPGRFLMVMHDHYTAWHALPTARKASNKCST